MLFNSVDFFIFFPIVLVIYFIIPKRVRYIWLLVVSYYFYMCWNPRYALLIGGSTIITYTSALVISNSRSRTGKKISLVASLTANLGILVIFKYANFLIDNLAVLCAKMGMTYTEKRIDLLLPIGISFYTFQALSYTIDVYNEKIVPERNILKYALFVSFFPQLVAGPIERSTKLLPQIQCVDKIRLWDCSRVRDGIMLMAWGYFQKLVIADRISLLTDTVINDYGHYGLVEIGAAIILFAIQIYCDFGGYTNIARGAARVMGFELMNNFKQPYLATSIKEFWRRWHISLTTWFTDYLYIPLGGNRKGTLRKWINILIVFGISGLWHGASWNFVVWGLLHAMYQIVGEMRNVLESRLNINWSFRDLNALVRMFRIFIVFVLVDFAWLFFASPSLTDALGMIRRMCSCTQTSGICNIGLDVNNWIVLIVSTIILFVVDIIHEKNVSIFRLFEKRMLLTKMLLTLMLVWIIIMFGIYGRAYDASEFIYFQF